MQYQPNTTTAPGYGFGFIFQQGTLADANDHKLAQGTLAVRVQPGAVSPFDLAILSRLLQPFSGYFEMDVMGTYSTGDGVDILVDSILGTDIQPS